MPGNHGDRQPQPPLYNGIKIKQDGRAVPETVTTAVESFLDKTARARLRLQGKIGQGGLFGVSEIQWINPAAVAKGLKRPVVIDYMHGAAAGLMEELLPRPNFGRSGPTMTPSSEARPGAH